MAEVLAESDPKEISPSQYCIRLVNFLEEYMYEEIEDLLLQSRKTDDQNYSFFVDSQDLIDFESSLAFTVLNYPKLLLPLFKESLLEVQQTIGSHPSFNNKHGKKGDVKKLVHIRMKNLPPLPQFVKSHIGDIRATCESLVQIYGTIVRTNQVRMLEVSKTFECQSPKCRHRFHVFADPEQNYMMPQPQTCPKVFRDDITGSDKKCPSNNIRELIDERICVDYQEIKVQDRIEKIPLGCMPSSIMIVLQSNLVDVFNPGDDVVITGTVIRQWKYISRGVRCSIDLAINANSISLIHEESKPIFYTNPELSNRFSIFWNRFSSLSDQLDARDMIIRSVCPQLYGMMWVKLAVLLSIIGGRSTEFDGSIKRRSQIHLLMIGDPGCGKLSCYYLTQY